ncbi:MAG: 50S ribosomal protein L29 [Candidatus Moranbacteria bacterium]|nr:50S ribosomal protein L29 [Candidatus Moranbacteria bacterium]
MKAREWREKSNGEREKALLEQRDKARKLRFDLATRETKTHSEYRKTKKDIARLMTLEQEASVTIDAV